MTELGWYHIGEVWNLYQDVYDDELQETKRVLTHVHVDFICVDEPPEDRDDVDYHVDHYDRGGELITSLSLTEEDLADELGDRETTDRPMHI